MPALSNALVTAVSRLKRAYPQKTIRILIPESRRALQRFYNTYDSSLDSNEVGLGLLLGALLVEKPFKISGISDEAANFSAGLLTASAFNYKHDKIHCSKCQFKKRCIKENWKGNLCLRIMLKAYVRRLPPNWNLSQAAPQIPTNDFLGWSALMAEKIHHYKKLARQHYSR